MKRRAFISTLSVAVGALSSRSLFGNIPTQMNYSIRLIRHATLLVEMGGRKILVDPMLSAKDAMDPIGNASNALRIPMVDLPFDKKVLNGLLDEVDGILVTHTHRDHWDEAAQELIDKKKPILCQPEDLDRIKGQGFDNVEAVLTTYDFQGITIHRTGGQHGTGEIGKKMGPVSGFVLSHNGNNVYIAGDTIWCDEVDNAIAKHKPGAIVLNAGGAQFLQGDPITMSPSDIRSVMQKANASNIIAVHMDTVNHCHVKRDDLAKAFIGNPDQQRLAIPADGETLTF